MISALFSAVIPFVAISYVSGIPVVREQDANSSKPLENLALFQGDIRFPARTSTVTTRNGVKVTYATSSDSLLWPGGYVYYMNQIEDDYFLGLLEEAMREIESKTCVKFVERSWYHNDYVELIQDSGCWSYVGRVGGSQQLSLGSTCGNMKLMLHELMHSIGFYHKHSQHDRDQYLTIHWNNIQEKAREQFDKIPFWWTRTFTDFDFMSIMLYGPRLFSADGRSVTMSRKDGGRLLDVEDKPGLSSKDAYSINKLYQCTNYL